MHIDIWSDVVCPWCYLGKRRFEKALAGFDGRDDVTIGLRSFQLDPSFPADKTMPATEMLRAKYRMSEAQALANTERVEQMAAADGLAPYVVGDNLVGNTRLAHELLAFAAERGLEDAAWKRLYKAYWAETKSLFDLPSLVALAADIGLDPAEAREALTSGRYTAKVENDAREARALGIATPNNEALVALLKGRELHQQRAIHEPDLDYDAWEARIARGEEA